MKVNREYYIDRMISRYGHEHQKTIQFCEISEQCEHDDIVVEMFKMLY